MAAIAAAGIGAVGNIIAGNQAAKAQKKAAQLQAQQYAQTKESLSPYMNAGSTAMDQYGNAIGLNGADKQSAFYQNFQTDPGFKASQDYAQRGIENSNAIAGRGYGGNVIAGLGDYLQKNMLGAYQNRISQIGGVVDTGKSAALGLGGIGQQSATAQGTNLANAGYYQGAGLANAGNNIMQGMNNYNQQNGYNAGNPGNGLNNANNYIGTIF